MKLPLQAFVLSAAVCVFGAVPARAAICAPSKLVHITVSNATPGIDPASYDAQPKNYYRVGNDKMRIEEALDSANGIHGLIVVAEPNIWMANLYDNTGKHIVDPGPTFNVKAPVIAVQGLSSKLLGLEFGCEADYIAANGPKPVRSEQVGGAAFDVYRFEDGADAVELLERPAGGAPSYARYYHQGRLAMVLRYEAYQTGLASEPSLFVPPVNVKYTETSPH
jgi:hypothetical protein